MARKTVTTYVCDSCGSQTKKAKDLRRFKVTADPTTSSYRTGPSVTIDLCGLCEDKFLEGLSGFATDEDRVAGLARNA